LLVASYIYAAGYFILIIFGLSILMIASMLFLHKPELFDWKRIFTIIATGGILSALISIAKLAASFSFMSYFPRLIVDNYAT